MSKYQKSSTRRGTLLLSDYLPLSLNSFRHWARGPLWIWLADPIIREAVCCLHCFTKDDLFLKFISACFGCCLMDSNQLSLKRKRACYKHLHQQGGKASRSNLGLLEKQASPPKLWPRTEFDHQAPVYFLSLQSTSSQTQNPLWMQFWVCLDEVESN